MNILPDKNLLNTIKNIMHQNGLHFNKSLGQNFLISQSALDTIVQNCGIIGDSNLFSTSDAPNTPNTPHAPNAPDTTDAPDTPATPLSATDPYVIEIGGGLGVLTHMLAAQTKNVYTFELDSKLADFLRLNTSATIINEDFLTADISPIIQRAQTENKQLFVVANLPYYITSPIITKLLENAGTPSPFNAITVMLQKEVAQRMVAPPGTSRRGAFSIFVQFYTTPNIICNVPANCFMPAPKVDSAVVRLTPHASTITSSSDDFFRLVKQSFLQKRKMLVNSLSSFYGKQTVINALSTLNINPKVRAEDLSITEFDNLTQILHMNRAEKPN
ncbi:MAG: 16S rRNA (adenine(1518)-N(6)/adenine(1519)-N(6))-dimethyltransferase RsmA [Clostridiales bacterium]|jgi:16S rRNA (adenine1518-N6/adenine1519-N6)-dimethyltransferase|nr:16S rRNA (adenine(1518)-N(6)/adenine(1519)-N(6))-dimethyltransferase RsmA [Clostridiales bacterium]